MTAAFALMALALPSFAPAPVPKEMLSGTILALGAKEPTITLKCNGKAVLFKVAPGAKVSINGAKGYSLVDVDEIRSFHKAVVSLKVEDGVVRSLEVKLTLPKGDSLWQPGEGFIASEMRRAREELRKQEERSRQLRQGGP